MSSLLCSLWIPWLVDLKTILMIQMLKWFNQVEFFIVLFIVFLLSCFYCFFISLSNFDQYKSRFYVILDCCSRSYSVHIDYAKICLGCVQEICLEFVVNVYEYFGWPNTTVWYSWIQSQIYLFCQLYSCVFYHFLGTVERYRVLEKLSDNTMIFHQIHKRVWPSSQRDTVFVSHIRQLGSKEEGERIENEIENAWMVTNWATEHEEAPVSVAKKLHYLFWPRICNH